jgi:toxin HigB-1
MVKVVMVPGGVKHENATIADDQRMAQIRSGRVRPPRSVPSGRTRHGLPGAGAGLVRRKLSYVHAVATVADLRMPPGNWLESLKGSLTGRFSIRVNDQCRITFRFEAGQAGEVRCEDDHSDASGRDAPRGVCPRFWARRRSTVPIHSYLTPSRRSTTN